MTSGTAGSAAASVVIVGGGPEDFFTDAAAAYSFAYVYGAMERNFEQFNIKVLYPWVNKNLP